MDAVPIMDRFRLTMLLMPHLSEFSLYHTTYWLMVRRSTAVASVIARYLTNTGGSVDDSIIRFVEIRLLAAFPTPL